MSFTPLLLNPANVLESMLMLNSSITKELSKSLLVELDARKCEESAKTLVGDDFDLFLSTSSEEDPFNAVVAGLYRLTNGRVLSPEDVVIIMILFRCGSKSMRLRSLFLTPRFMSAISFLKLHKVSKRFGSVSCLHSLVLEETLRYPGFKNRYLSGAILEHATFVMDCALPILECIISQYPGILSTEIPCGNDSLPRELLDANLLGGIICRSDLHIVLPSLLKSYQFAEGFLEYIVSLLKASTSSETCAHMYSIIVLYYDPKVAKECFMYSHHTPTLSTILKWITTHIDHSDDIVDIIHSIRIWQNSRDKSLLRMIQKSISSGFGTSMMTMESENRFLLEDLNKYCKYMM